MDLITASIVTALSSLAQTAIKDAYDALKTSIARKYGEHSDLSQAISKLEGRPDSNARREMLKEEVEITKADKDAEILQALQALRQALDQNQKRASSSTTRHSSRHKRSDVLLNRQPIYRQI